MWAKDTYQEQMLAYLGEVETEIEQLADSHIRQHDLNELHIDLDIAAKRLWRLIGASDMDWEGFRYPLETSYDQLQRTFYRIPLPRSGALMLSTSVTIAEDYESRAELWEMVEMLR